MLNPATQVSGHFISHELSLLCIVLGLVWFLFIDIVLASSPENPLQAQLSCLSRIQRM